MTSMAARLSSGSWVIRDGDVEGMGSSIVQEENSVSATEVLQAITAAPAVEVEQVQCECCGLADECTAAYIARVRAIFCGHWVCGLCAEAVQEERGRARRLERLDVGLEDALQTHMSFCMAFNNSERTSPVLHLAAAMSRLLKRGLDGRSASHSAPSSPRRSPLSRSSSCIRTVSPEC